MKNIIVSALATQKRILWIGSAAMADILFDEERKAPPALGLVGSVSSVTRSQVKFAEQSSISVIKVPFHEILTGKDIKDYVSAAKETLKAGKDLILCSSSSYDAEEHELTNETGKKSGVSNEEIGNFIQKKLAEASKEILTKVKVSGVFLTGGDTAIGFFNELNSVGSSVLTEVSLGIPMMSLKGGDFDGLKVITKAGAFGKEDAVSFSMRKIKEVVL